MSHSLIAPNTLRPRPRLPAHRVIQTPRTLVRALWAEDRVLYLYTPYTYNATYTPINMSKREHRRYRRFSFFGTTHIPESRSTRTWVLICWIRSLSDVAETWWDASGIFACPDTDSFSARCRNREKHSPLAMRTAIFAHALVLLAEGLTLCYGESINLTWYLERTRRLG